MAMLSNYPSQDKLYPPLQRLQFALQELGEVKKEFKRVKSEEPTSQRFKVLIKKYTKS